MRFVKLDPPCAKASPAVRSVDPVPWTLEDILAELESIEKKLGSGASAPSPLKQPQTPHPARAGRGSPRPVAPPRPESKPFVMCVSDDDDDGGTDSDDDDDGGGGRAGTRFSCADIDFSDSEDSYMMSKKTLEEGILSELELEYQLKVKEQVRSKLSLLELQQKCERERMSSAMLQIQKYAEARREMDRKMDQQYQRKIAEVTDNHLSAVQREHEQRSLVEERRIRDDAALEEAKLKERARQEKAKAEAEARLKAAKRAEEEEAARRVHEEAAEKEATRVREKAAAEVAEKAARQQKVASKESGIRVLAAENALKAEANRVALYNEVAGKIHIQQKDFDRRGRQIFKFINQIGGTLENVRSKAYTLVNIINDPTCPRSLSIFIFAKKVISVCETPRGSSDRTAFACARVILLVESQIPGVLDFVLAEFHKACIYTVPKHFHPSDVASQNNDYWKLVGYREEDNKMETADVYLSRMQSYMKLYAAVVHVHLYSPYLLLYGY